jgi:hypothetical protein
MNNWCVCCFLHIFLLGILIFKGLTARRIYKSFGVKGLSIFTTVSLVTYVTAEQSNRRYVMESRWVYRGNILTPVFEQR